MLVDRVELYKRLETERQSKLLVYVTSDRRGMETQISGDILNFFTHHLDIIKKAPKISLFLYTRGGQTIAAWSLVNLIKSFCDQFEIIVPFNCHSAGTLICLGANNIVMTKQATLGPIDPSTNGYMNPEKNINGQNIRIPVSVEVVNGYLQMAQEDLKINDPNALAQIFLSLSEKIHPLSLGEVYRSKSQIQMLARKLLTAQGLSPEKQDKIIKFLCSESGSHDYTIYRKEAREELGLSVETPSEEFYDLISKIFKDIESELELTTPYDPKLLLGANNTQDYKLRRALVESVEGGCHVFISEGTLIKQNIQIPAQLGIQIPQTAVQDSRKFDGWKHEPLVPNP